MKCNFKLFQFFSLPMFINTDAWSKFGNSRIKGTLIGNINEWLFSPNCWKTKSKPVYPSLPFQTKNKNEHDADVLFKKINKPTVMDGILLYTYTISGHCAYLTQSIIFTDSALLLCFWFFSSFHLSLLIYLL